MKKFITMNSRAIPLPIENIDTDQIIPARFLKNITKNGFGKNLFRDWRFNSDGSINQNFILNNNKYKGNILVTKKNFGCGSSREHAAWAIFDYGFRVVISSFFADIFVNNALNNGLLTIQVSEYFLNLIFSYINNNPKIKIYIDLNNQSVMIDNYKEYFNINSYKKQCLINGYDDIDYLLTIKEEILKFQKNKIFFN